VRLPPDIAAKCLELAGINPCEGLSEAAFQAKVVALAVDNGFEVYHTFDSRRSAPGYPDLVIAKPGRLIVAELKVGRNKPTPAQEKWLRLYESIPGVRVFRWRETDWSEIRKELESP
jgi:hypothetical protein